MLYGQRTIIGQKQAVNVQISMLNFLPEQLCKNILVRRMTQHHVLNPTGELFPVMVARPHLTNPPHH